MPKKSLCSQDPEEKDKTGGRTDSISHVYLELVALDVSQQPLHMYSFSYEAT